MSRISKVFQTILLVVDFPSLFWGYLRVLLLWPWAVHQLRMTERGVLTAVWREWAADLYPYSLTIARGVSYLPGRRREYADDPRTRLEEHEEEVHVPQFSNEAIKGLLVGLAVGLVTDQWWLALALWMSSPAWIVANFIGALLWWARPRQNVGWFEHWFIRIMYRDSEHERSAYAQTDNHPNSWLVKHRRVRDRR